MRNRPDCVRRPPAALAAATLFVAILGTQRPPNASIRGVVTGPDDAHLPGVTITVEGEGLRRQVYSDADGAYVTYGLMPGDYDVIARLDGFCTQRRSPVRVRSRTATYVDFSLDFVAVEYRPGHGIVYQPPEAVRYADAVVHLRINRIYELERWSGDGYCGAAGIEYEAVVLGAMKRHALHGPAAPRVRFLQYPVGRWSDGVLERYPVDLHEHGDEFVALLGWDENVQRFRPFRDRYMVPVHDGVISWEYAATNGIRDGMPVDELIEILRFLSQPGG